MPATSDLPVAVGWRLCFGLGVVLGLVVLLVRRNVPESPRWLFIHGRAEQAEDLVDGIEHRVEAETGARLSEPSRSITIRQRKTIGFVTIARTMFTRRDGPRARSGQPARAAPRAVPGPGRPRGQPGRLTRIAAGTG